MFAQVKLSLRTVSVAVRVLGRESSRRHGHIDDMHRAVVAELAGRGACAGDLLSSDA